MYADGTRSGRPRDPGRDTAILNATLDLLGEVGYEKVTVRAIAQRAGAGLATLYRRWPTKDDLVVDAVARLQPRVDEAPPTAGHDGSGDGDGPAGDDGGGNPVEALVTLIVGLLDTLQGERTRGLIPNLIGQLPGNPALAESLRARVVRPRLAAVTAQLRRVPGVDQDRVAATAELIPASLFFQVLFLGRELGADDVRALVGTVVTALREAPPGARG